MIIKITVFDTKQYLKSGRLKKKPQQDFGRILADVEPHKETDTDDFLKETAVQLKRYYKCFESPYFFTHLKAVKIDTNEPVYIYEEVMHGNDYIMTSPIKLRDYLTK